MVGGTTPWWQASAAMFKERPLVGFGLGRVPREAASFGGGPMRENTHNLFLQLLAETPAEEVLHEIVAADALRYLAQAGARFDVVFLDPPFRQNAWPALFERLPRCLAPGARVSLEASAPQDAPQGWRELRRLRAGRVSVQLLQWDAE